MRNAFALGWRNIVDDPRRAVLGMASVALGVALLTATVIGALSARQTVVDGLSSLVTVGDVGIVPAGGTEFLSADTMSLLAEADGVVEALPTLSRETAVRGPAAETATLFVTGVPMGASALIDSVVKEGHAPSPGSSDMLVPQDIADRLGVRVGQSLVVAVPGGRVTAQVAGLAEPAALGVFGRENVFLDLPSAQEAFDLQGRLTRLDLVLDPAVSDGWAANHADSLPEGARFQDTAALADGLAPLDAALSAIAGLLGLVTLGLATVLGSSASIAAARRRRREYGLLRALGATPRWLGGTVVAELGLVTAAGSIVGAATGAVVGVLASPAAHSPTPGIVAVGAALGVACGAFSSVVGARRAVAEAASTQPATAIRAGHAPLRPSGRRRAPAVLTVLGVVAAVVCSQLEGATAAVTGLVALAAAAVPAAKLLVRPLASVFGRVHWAAEVASRRSSRGREGIAASLSLVVFGGVALTMCVSAVSAATVEQVDRQFGADVQVSSIVPLEDGVVSIAGLPGVGEVAASTWGDGVLASPGGDLDVSYQAIDSDVWFRVAGLAWLGAAEATGPEELAGGGGVALPRGVAELLHVKQGDQVRLGAGDDEVELRVVGLFTSVATGQTIVVDQSTALQFGAPGASRWDVSAAPGADVTRLADDVREAVQDIPGIEAITAQETRVRAADEVTALTAGLFVVVALALVLGALGASSSFGLDVESRRRELALLRVTGCDRRAVGVLIAWEASIVGVVAVVVGTTFGILGGVLGTGLVSSLLGIRVDPVGSVSTLFGVVGIVVLAVAAAAVGPTRRAISVHPLSAIRGLS
jgi:putative ABC transport system permease protein